MSDLNPYAPEYHPMPPPPPSSAFPQFYPPPSFQPQPVLYPLQTFSYLPSATYATYQTQISTNPPPPLQVEVLVNYPAVYGASGNQIPTVSQPQPQTEVLNNSDQPRRRQRRGILDNQNARGRGNSSNGGFRRDDDRGMQRGRIRHQVTPLNSDAGQTTVMIKNIPYDCLRRELMEILDEFCSMENTKTENIEGSSRNPGEHVTSDPAAYDFLYLPVDFKTKRGRGFAFVNFTNSTTVWKFFESFHLKDWKSAHPIKWWNKKIEIVRAKVQGKEALVRRLTDSFFECESDEFLPVRFEPARDGSGRPVVESVVGSRRGNGHREALPRNNHEA